MLKRASKFLSALVPLHLYERASAYAMLKEVFGSLQTAPTFETREDLWSDYFSLHNLTGARLLVLEFGVYEGSSIKAFSNLNTHPESQFLGFDSFDGLPEDWGSTHPKGTFNLDGNIPKIVDPRIKFIKGWFNKTVARTLDANTDLVEEVKNGQRELIVHLDADLFSSTLYALFTVSHYFSDYHFIFDEFIGDETRALYAFTKGTGAIVDFRSRKLSEGYPKVVAGKIKL